MTKTLENPSRRAFFRQSAMAASVLGATVASRSGLAAPPPVRKQTKQEAGYREHPTGPYRCGICANFISPNDCKKVQGPVTPSGWCQNFKTIDE